jgi:hypothetical protein
MKGQIICQDHAAVPVLPFTQRQTQWEHESCGKLKLKLGCNVQTT